MKKKLIYGMFAIILGIGISVANVSASSYDPTGPAGFPPVPQLGGMLWNHGGIGDALSGQMYRSVVSNIGDPFRFVTYISIENVSNNWVAAHVRLRSGRYSIEVRDFPILLSPRDVFWFQFEAVPGAGGDIEAVRIFSNDLKTLEYSGLPAPWEEILDGRILKDFTKLAYTDAEVLEEMTQGYIEVIGLWETTSDPGNFFDAMNTMWTQGGTDFDLRDTPNVEMHVSHAGGPLDVGKSLAGHVFMGDFENGLYFGYAMEAIKDFRTSNSDPQAPPPIPIRIQPFHRDIDAVKATSLGGIVPLRTGRAVGVFAAPAAVPGPAIWYGVNNAGAMYRSGVILYEYAQDHAYSDPDWATSFGPTWNDGDDLTNALLAPALWGFDSWSLDEVDDALVKQRVQSTYFNGGFSLAGDPNGGTYTLAAVTFTTKYLHYFYDVLSGLLDDGMLLPLGDVIDGTQGSLRFGWPVGYQLGQATGIRNVLPVEKWTGQVHLRTAAWDLEENIPVDWSPFRNVRFPWEVNFIAIGDLSIDKLDPFCFLVVPQPDAPYGLLKYADGYNAGQVIMEGFSLSGGIVTGDPRTMLGNGLFGGFLATGGYARANLPLLGALEAVYGDPFILPASVLMMDWEFTNFSHARSFKPNWDNMVLPGDYPIQKPN